MLSVLFIGATISCDDNDEELFTTAPSSDLKFTSTPAASYLLTFDTRMNTAERFTWESVDFTTPVAVTYQLEAVAGGDDFANAELVGSTSSNEIQLSVEDLNDLSATLGLTPFSQGVISLRLVALLADPSQPTIVSDVINLNVTPYTTDSPKLWVPGNYADSSGYGANWTPDDPETPFLQAVEFGSTEFEGFIFMSNASPEFKFTPGQSFDGAFGDGGAGMLSNDGGAGNLTVPGPGYYYITVNTDPDGDPTTNDATWNASARTWGIIGAATQPTNAAGWDDELDMTYNQDTKLWTVELDMQVEDFKFRAQTWDFPEANFGKDENGDASQLSFNGPNLSVAAGGRYRAELDLSTPRNYTYQLVSI